MAISSPLNPGVIAPARKATAEQFQNFISGGSPLGSAVFTSAANKIVGFQRGAARVAPQVPNLGDIINTLSTNILNNVENRVSSINQEVNKVVIERLNALEGDYKSRVQQIDANAPSKILENFMSLYQRAIGLVQFLGNPRNSKRLSDSITALQSVFKETFDVAKQIRQTINRIINQLSNLPQATGGGGDVSVDVDIPGAGLRKSGGGILKRMGGRRGLALGAATLGTGYMANQAINAMSQPENAIQPQLMGDVSGGLGGPILDRFDAAVKRFDKILTLILRGQGRATSQSKSTAAASTEKEQQEPQGPPSGKSTLIPGNAPPEMKAFMSTIAGPESGGNYEAMNPGTTLPGATKMTIAEVAKKATGAVGKYQNMPEYLVARAKAAGLDPNKDLYSPENQEKITRVDIVNLLGGDESKVVKMLQQDPARVAQRLRTHWSSLPGGGEQQLSTQEYLKKYTTYLETYKKMPGSATPDTLVLQTGDQKPPGTTTKPQGKPTVIPAPTQQMVQQQIAQQVSQPPASQMAPQINVMPMNASGQQSTTKPIQDSVTVGGNKSHQVSFLPSTNPDNFLTLYSKMVYNIVDG